MQYVAPTWFSFCIDYDVFMTGKTWFKVMAKITQPSNIPSTLSLANKAQERI